MSNKQDGFNDFIAFLDKSDEKKELWVRILSKDNGLVMFKLKSGKIRSVPTHRILEIKEVDKK